MVNFYKGMAIRQFDMMAPLTKLTSEKEEWKWTNVEQTTFGNIKKVLYKETLLTYPDSLLEFELDDM